MATEHDLIAAITAQARPLRADVVIGIGDDAAVLADGLTVCQDTLNVDVHFRADDPPAAIGHKALAVNLSDLAAMGAEPAWATLSLSLPQADPSWVEACIGGFLKLARRFDVDLIGGDTTRGPLSLSVCAGGRLAGAPLRRAAARTGDDLWVSGTLGDAAAGLHDSDPYLLDRLQRPEPRVDLGLALVGVASACIDLSDGLASDLPRLLGARLGARISSASIPRSERFCASAAGTLARALGGGDDYELAFTARPEERERIGAIGDRLGLLLTRIGSVDDGPGMRLDGADLLTISGGGYDHFT